jgi:hypothetical protein
VGTSFPTATLEEWRQECIRRGLLDETKRDSSRSMFSKYRLKLIGDNWIACTSELAWILP